MGDEFKDYGIISDYGNDDDDDDEPHQTSFEVTFISLYFNSPT